jgi:3-hydroxyisobutyrate dehydrogenase-like beta-hydroxyacid dehydrogenase
MSMTATIAVLGLGEAGGALARDLVAAGAVVRGYDPAVPASDGVLDTGSESEAADGADLVLSVNSASAAVDALESGVGTAAMWADLNTASPGTKRRLAEIATAHGVPFADVAIMAPVPGKGLRVPMLATGEAAERVAQVLRPFGASVEVMSGPAGLAAERKLLRSVFFKGMAAAVVEALTAARAAGCEDWLREIIENELTNADATTVERLVSGSYRHARRRTGEMAAAAEMLDELGVAADVAGAARDHLARL